MKHPISFDLEKQYPNIERGKRLPANSTYRISYAETTCWKHEHFSIVEQDYDAKDTYLSLIEINTTIPLQLTLSTIGSDLYWLYQLKGNIKIKPYPNDTEHNGFLDPLQEDKYALFYSPPREYTITIEPGLHTLFFFVVNATWLKRHPIVEPTQFQKLVNYLHHKKDRYTSTKLLTIHDAIRKEILHLLTLPDFEEMLMDAKVYTPIVKLVLISREDLKTNGIPISQNMNETLLLIRTYFKKQISLGQAPPIMHCSDLESGDGSNK